MANSIWERLPLPIFSLAPMEDVTDTVFRKILVDTGRPDVFFTEFTNVDGMMSAGDKKVSQRLLFEELEKPLIAQIWGVNPENFYKAAQRIVSMGFDGIDLNMGCPQRDVTRHGACSALIKNHALAIEIIQATREGAGNLPVSVKTRLGFGKIQTEEWIGFLLEQDLPLITVHGRTVAEMSKVPAHWDEIGKVVKMRNEYEKGVKRDKSVKGDKGVDSGKTGIQEKEWIPGQVLRPFDKLRVITAQDKGDSGQHRTARNDKGGIASSSTTKVETPRNDNVHTLIFGNGDVQSLEEAKEKVQKYGVDGVMIGRGIFHNPWLFAGVDTTTKTVRERLELLQRHVAMYQSAWADAKSFQVLKKYFKIYVSDFEGASEMRAKFMETNTYEEAIELAESLLVY